jgi:membrane protein required for colicin V production
MEFNYFDLVVSIVILLLGLKGIINGFFKEVFGLIGIIGGIFIASRASGFIAKQIDSHIFHLENFAALELIGFLIVLATIWFVTSSMGNLYLGATKDVPSSQIGMAFGFVTAGTKYFLIFSLIIPHIIFCKSSNI